MVICPLMLVPEINFSRWDHDWDQAIRQAHACHCSVVMAWMPLSWQRGAMDFKGWD